MGNDIMGNNLEIGNISFADDPKWENKLKDSHIFIALGSENYFKDPECFEQAWMATKQDKIGILLLTKGTKIPKGFPLPRRKLIVDWDGSSETVRSAINKVTELYPLT